MKCPKCGSPRTGRDSALKRRCKNCNINIEQYQARLDKVLSKMNKKIVFANKNKIEGFHYDLAIDDDTNDGLIYYFDGKFRLYRDEYIISLDTVESLIKDLEGKQ